MRALGFDTHVVGLTLDEARNRLDPTTAGEGLPVGQDGRPDLEAAGHLFVDVFARSTAADLAILVQQVDVDLIVYEQGEFGAALVAHAAGIPAVCHTLSPQMPPEMQHLIFGARLAQLWADHAMAAPDSDPAHQDLMLDPFPAVLQLPSFLADPRRLRMRPTPFAEPGTPRPSWLERSTRPLIYLTLGTVMATDEALRSALHGLAALDVEVLVALGSADGASLGDLPSNVHVCTESSRGSQAKPRSSMQRCVSAAVGSPWASSPPIDSPSSSPKAATYTNAQKLAHRSPTL